MRTQTPLLFFTHPGTGELRRRRWILEVVEGIEPSRKVELQRSPALLGEAPASVLPLGDDTVSRYHAELEIFAEGVRLRDLDSTNGTFVGEERIFERFLEPNTEFRVGQTVLRLRAEDEPAASEIDTDPRGLTPDAIERVGHAIAANSKTRELLRLVRKIALASSPVLFEGESGVGRATLARLLHDQSSRKASPFVTLTLKSGADPDDLAVRMFGRSARGSTPARPSLFETAKGGTVFFEDIENMPQPTQQLLLEAVERGEIQRLGEERKIRIDVRIVASTTRNLIEEPSFERGLLRRVGVVRLRVPPLRQRSEDVRAIALQFATQLLGPNEILGPRAIALLQGRDLPGNLDQLRVLVASLKSQDLSVVTQNTRFGLSHVDLVHQLRQAHVEDVITRHRGDVTRASRELAMEPRALFRFLQKHDIELDTL